jgi:DNA-binding transcriptional ArsR family regulator
MVLSDLDQMRLLADPLRRRIVEAFQMEPATARQVASSLGEKPSRIYHHVEALERAGLLRLVATRRKRGTTERYLSAVAKAFVVDRALFAPSRGADAERAAEVVQHAVVDLLLESARELGAGIRTGTIRLDDPERCELGRVSVHLSDSQRAVAMRKLRALVAEVLEMPAEDGATTHHLLIGLYPTSG